MKMCLIMNLDKELDKVENRFGKKGRVDGIRVGEREGG